MIFLVLLAIFILFMIWLLPKVWRSIKQVFGYIRGLFSGNYEADKKHFEVNSVDPDIDHPV